ncbi:MAG: hypothetical protein H8D84_02115, partial [Proteobacteria bacterium]|nr:hypothetical protein [Pseudomonadota bacterium]
PIPASTGFVGDGSFPFTTGIPSPTNFGLITDGIITNEFPLQREDYNLVTQETFYILPTKCQTYEQDLGVQKLSTLGGYDDYLFTITNPTRNEDDGLVTDLTDNETDDFGWVFQDPNGVTQLRLGPLRRTIDRQKFNTQGGFSQALDTVKGVGRIVVINGGSGYTSVPTVTITKSSNGLDSGSGALATAVISGGVVTSITIDDIGSGYDYHPTATITGGGGSNATATAVRQITTGNPIENFSEREIAEFVLFAGLKTKKVVNSMVVQYNSGTESTSLPFTQIG